jgi:hypothetical protein
MTQPREKPQRRELQGKEINDLVENAALPAGVSEYELAAAGMPKKKAKRCRLMHSVRVHQVRPHPSFSVFLTKNMGPRAPPRIAMRVSIVRSMN